MKAIFLSFFAGIFCVLAVSAQPVMNDPNVQPRQVGSFDKIVVGGSFDVFINQSDSYGVAVSARNTEETNKIKTEVKNGTLYIKYESGSWAKGDMELKAYVSVKELSRMEVNGACDVITKGMIAADALEISISGSSDFTGAVAVRNLKLDASGASDYRMQGKAENCKISVSGSSDVKAYELITEFCEVSVSGASDVQITVNKELKANGSGASDINYKGTGIIRESKLSGASDIKKRD